MDATLVLVYVGAIVLVWTAVEMILEDQLVHEWREFAWWEILAVAGVVAAVVVWLGVRAQRLATPAELEEKVEEEAAPDVAATDAAAERREPAGDHAATISRNGREPVAERPGARQPAP